MRRLSLIVVALLLVLVAWVGWSLWQARESLLAARWDADRLRTAVEAGEQQQAERSLGRLQERAAEAEDRTDGPILAALTWLPLIGDDLAGVRAASAAVSVVAERGLPPLVAASADVTAGTFLPRDGRFPLARIAGLQDPLAESGRAFDDARGTLAAEDPSSYVGPLASAYDDLAAQVGDGAEALAVAETASVLLPSMLGADGDRSYIALFQNNAEIRSLGGIPGAASLLVADEGRLEMGRQTPALLPAESPVLELTREEKNLYGQQPAIYFQDITLIPDFPRVAELAAAHWQRAQGDQVDGVVSMDVVALSYLLEGTGPVTVDGVEIRADNAVDVLLRDTYQRLDPVGQNVFFAKVARAVFERMTSGDGDSQVLLRSLIRGVDEGRLMVSSFDEDDRDLIEGTQIASELAGPDDPPELGIYLNDGTRSKLSYYLDYEVTELTCDPEAGTLTGTLELSSRVPEGGAGLTDYQLGDPGGLAKRGDQLVQVELHAPYGAEFEEVSVDGKKRPMSPSRYDGHEVLQTFVTLRPRIHLKLQATLVKTEWSSVIAGRVTPPMFGTRTTSLSCER